MSNDWIHSSGLKHRFNTFFFMDSRTCYAMIVFPTTGDKVMVCHNWYKSPRTAPWIDVYKTFTVPIQLGLSLPVHARLVYSIQEVRINCGVKYSHVPP